MTILTRLFPPLPTAKPKREPKRGFGLGDDLAVT
ncbi:hypothetical protein CAPI_07135 [Corynebacterium capitovis DSM 44611]|nr:hypothetical protein CAPI_07135 [Corynebacterium capitovis DSM 44611]